MKSSAKPFTAWRRQKWPQVYHKADLNLIRQGGSQVDETSVAHGDGTVHAVLR